MALPESAAPQGSFTVHYNEPMLRDAVRTYVWRRVIRDNKGFSIVTFGMLALLLGFLASGERGVVIGILSAGVVAAMLVVMAVWRTHHVNTLGAFRRLEAPEARLTFSEAGVAIEADRGSGTLPWSSIDEAWERPGYWMVFTGKNRFTTWPVESLPAEVQDWLRGQLSGRNKN